jgi:small-conductance mechanosensitive channel
MLTPANLGHSTSAGAAPRIDSRAQDELYLPKSRRFRRGLSLQLGGGRRCFGVVLLVVSVAIMIAALFLLSGQDVYSALGLLGLLGFLVGFTGFAAWLANTLGEEQKA